MDFCDDCGALVPPDKRIQECEECGAILDREDVDPSLDTQPSESEVTTDLERLSTTKSGSVKKEDAMEWLEGRDRPSGTELRRAMIEKPSDFTGSTFPTEISTIRLTGDPQFIETVAGLFSWIVDMEDYSRRVEINLKETEDKESGDQTGNYALYLSVAERG